MATVLDRPQVDGLREGFRGELFAPDDDGYEEARRVYNAMIDRRPALVARCRDVADVIDAVGFARRQGLEVAVRGGGHNGAGFGTVDGGIVIDLCEMHGVRVDPERRLATVEAGAQLGDLDHAAHAFGLATPAGILSTTGVAGLTLGGGHGYLSRKFGLTIDNLTSADVVLADGRLVTADEEHHPDLFWALRGGGGNFGVVTSFTLRLHPVSTIVGGPTLWPLEAMEDVLAWYREFQPAAPEDIYGFFATLTVPPAPPFPEELHLRKACGIVWCCTCAADEADELAFGPARAVAEPMLHGVQEMPYPALQSAFDELYPKGDQWYWRGDFFGELPDDAVARHIEFAHRLPSVQSSMHLYPVDGAVHRVPADATPFSYRDSTWSQVIVGVDHEPASAEALRDWAVDYWEALHPFSQGGAYLNFMMDEGQERVRATFRDNYERLARVKGEYDPGNVFHVNQNIRPA
jgi:FAD/FMN-containing dehydrogenase